MAKPQPSAKVCFLFWTQATHAVHRLNGNGFSVGGFVTPPPEGLRYSRAFPERGFLYKYLENTKLGRPVVRVARTLVWRTVPQG